MRRKRRLTTHSQYPPPNREGRRISKREKRRRIIFWALIVCLAGVVGFAWYRSRKFTVDETLNPQPIDFKDPLAP